MTAFSNFDVTSICCLSLRQTMNLRKSRFSSGQKRNSSCKDIKSSVGKGRKPLIQTENARCSSKNLPKSSVKCKNLLIDDLLVVNTSNINLVTSTPVPHKARKRILRSSGIFNSDKITKLNSFNRSSSSIASSPIQKNSCQIIPCEIRLVDVKQNGKMHSSKRKSDHVLKNSKKPSNSEMCNFSLNSPVETVKENVIVRRNSMTLRSQNTSKELPNNTKLSLSPKPKSSRRISVTSQKQLQKSKKSVEQLVSQNAVLSENKKKNVRKSSATNDKSSFLNSKSNKTLIVKKSLDKDISQATEDSLFQSNHETDSSKSSRYGLRKSTASQNKSCSKKNPSIYSEKPLPSFSSTPKNCNSTLRKSIRVSGRLENVHNTECNDGKEICKSSRYSLRLQNQELSKRTSGNGISFHNSLISKNTTKTLKCSLEPSSNTKRSFRHSVRLEKNKPSKEIIVSKLSSQQFSKKTSNKKQRLVKKIPVNNNSEPSKKSSSSARKQMTQKKSVEQFQRKYFSLTENLPVDDLAMSKVEKRKVKSDGFKLPGKNTLKRKRCAIEAALKADEDYEDDLYETKKFDQFKVLLLDTSDSERSLPVSTPKFPVTPHIFHKTPKFKDCFSPGQYAISRKAALEYMYRNRKKKSGQKPPETPVITTEKKKLEFSDVLEDVIKLQKTIESTAEEESDNDSYFSSC